jgi:ABC-type glycerol-3-phosphate transport system substrate-binding protein
VRRGRLVAVAPRLALALLGGCGAAASATRTAGSPHLLAVLAAGGIQPLLDRYAALHPGVRIELQQLTWQSGLEKIEAAVAAGTAPDLCELGSTWLPRFAADGVLADLTAVAAPLEPHFVLWEPARRAGRTYGLPWVVGTRALFVNRALLAQAGLDPSRPPGTWDELLAAAARIAALGRHHGFARRGALRPVQEVHAVRSGTAARCWPPVRARPSTRR